MRIRSISLALLSLLPLFVMTGSISDEVSRREANRAAFFSAYRQYDSGDYHRAMQAFGSLSDGYPDLQDYSLFYLASSAMQLERPDVALAACERLLKDHGLSVHADQTVEIRLFALIDLGRYEEAERLAEEGLEGSEPPGDGMLRFVVARSHEGMGRYDQAASEYLMLASLFQGGRWHDQAQQRLRVVMQEREITPPTLSNDQVLEVAASHFDRGHPNTAGQYAKRLLDRGVSGTMEAEAKVYYANSLAKSKSSKDKEQAIKIFDEVIESRLDRSEWRAAALYLSADLLPDDGVERKSRVIADYSDTIWAAWAAFDLGNGSWSRRDFDSAADRLLFCGLGFKDFKDRNTALWRGGFAAYMEGRYDQAAAALELDATLESDSEDIQRALFWVARSIEARGDRPASLKAYFRVLELGPDEYYGLVSKERLRAMGIPPLMFARSDQGFLTADGSSAVRSFLAPNYLVPIGGSTEELIDNAIAGSDGPVAYHLVRARELFAASLSELGIQEIQSMREARNYGSPFAAAMLARALWQEDKRLLSLLVANYGHRLMGMRGTPDPYNVLARLRLPKPFFEEIKIRSDDLAVDPYLVLALMRQESAFQPGLSSRAGARGLMQVMPSTGQYIAKKRGLSPLFSSDDLYDADVSIDFGCWYIAHLLKREDGDPIRAIAGYNAGPGNVDKWWPSFSGIETAAAVELIPLMETRNYVKSVMRNWALYRNLYAADDGETPIRAMILTID